MKANFLDDLRGKTLYSMDGKAIISIYSESMAHQICNNIQELFKNISNFSPLGELPSGDVVGIIEDRLSVVLHDSGEIIPSNISYDLFLKHISNRNPELEKYVFGE